MNWRVSVLLLLVPIPAVVIAELKSELQQRPLLLTAAATPCIDDTAGSPVAFQASTVVDEAYQNSVKPVLAKSVPMGEDSHAAQRSRTVRNGT